MSNKNKLNNIIILGTGTSTGTPVIGCSCKVCNSSDQHDKRLRTSIILFTARGESILVDTTPDLRTQLLSNKINRVDYTIITHSHADHTHGIDDLRPFTFPPNGKPISLYTAGNTAKEMRTRFPYIFSPDTVFSKEKPILGGGIPNLLLIEIENLQQGPKNLQIGKDQFIFFTLKHGYTGSLGFIHEKFAYIPDCKEIARETIKMLKDQDLELLIINSLQPAQHQTHLTHEESFAIISAINPKKAGLIHMNHHSSHIELQNLAKSNCREVVFPTFDGQKLSYRDA